MQDKIEDGYLEKMPVELKNITVDNCKLKFSLIIFSLVSLHEPLVS